MPALPAITFLGLRGMAAWAALGAAGAGAYVVATRALPALARGGGGGAPARSTAEPTAELLVNLLRSASESSARVATSALGPGASLGVAGIGVARDVTGALERFAEQQTRAITQTSTELIRQASSQNLAILQLAYRPPASAPAASIPVPALVAHGPSGPASVGPVWVAPAAVVSTPAPPASAYVGPSAAEIFVGGGRPLERVTVTVDDGATATAETVRIAGSGFFESLPSWHPRSSSFDVKAWEAAGRPVGI